MFLSQEAEVEADLDREIDNKVEEVAIREMEEKRRNKKVEATTESSKEIKEFINER